MKCSKKLVFTAIALCFLLSCIAGCGKDKIISDVNYIEIEVDNSEETGELSYTDPLKITDKDLINSFLKTVNGGEIYTDDEFLSFESCPVLTFYLNDGNKISVVVNDYVDVFYTSTLDDFSDKTLYKLPSGSKLGENIEKAYNNNK